MKCIVTGGCGFIGSNLVKELLRQRHQIVVIDDLSTGKRENIPADVEFHQESICNPDVGRLLKDADVVFHLAARPRVQFSVDYPLLTNEVNVHGTLNMLQASKETGVKRFIFSSSSSVYGNQNSIPLVETMHPHPMSPYALQKLVGEEYCRLYYELHGMETICLRYFNVYGPGQDPAGGYAQMIPKFIRLVKSGMQPTIFGDGKKTRDFTFVGDIVAANLLAAATHHKEAFGQVFNIGAGKNIAVQEAADCVIRLLGSSVKPCYLPEVVEPEHTLADSGKAARVLGWKPEVSFEEGLKRMIEVV